MPEPRCSSRREPGWVGSQEAPAGPVASRRGPGSAGFGGVPVAAWGPPPGPPRAEELEEELEEDKAWARGSAGFLPGLQVTPVPLCLPLSCIESSSVNLKSRRGSPVSFLSGTAFEGD